MKEITTKYSDLIRQNIECTGTITNTYKGITIDLITEDYVTKDEFLLSFLKRFRTTYDIFPNEYNQKEYKRFLKSEIEDLETRLEELKFAHKICGRKILEK